MKVKTHRNGNGNLCTDEFDPDVDGYDPIEEEQRELSEQEALDDYMYGCEPIDDFDDIIDDGYDDGYDDEYDDPYDLYGSLYPDD